MRKFLYVEKIDSSEGAMYATNGGIDVKVLRIALTDEQSRQLVAMYNGILFKPVSIQDEEAA